METIRYINISLEILGSILSLIIMICICTGNYKEDKLKRLFLRILGSNIVVLLSDAAAWGFKGNVALTNRCIVYISNFLVYAFGYILLAVFTDYLINYIDTKTSIDRKPAQIVWILCIIAVILVIVSQFNHMYYLIDDNNMYQRKDWFWLSQVWGILCMIIDSLILIKYRKNLTKREIVLLFSYIILPVIAMSIQIFIYGIALLYITTTIAILAVYIGIQVEQAQELKQKELELSESRIAIMISQIQPHFVYNTLTAISRLCDVDSQKAKDVIIDFSVYLRNNLDSLSKKTLVPFEKELNHIQTYLSLEQIRFDDALEIFYELNTTDFFIPPLTVQPLIENAVHHGLENQKGCGTIHIYTEETKEAYKIIISDNGAGFETDKPLSNDKSHIGIDNVKTRLQLQCSGSLTIESIPNVGTKASITIPKQI